MCTGIHPVTRTFFFYLISLLTPYATKLFRSSLRFDVRAFLTWITGNIEFHRTHKFAILLDFVISRYIFEPRETRRARDYVLNASNFIVLPTTRGAISLGNPKWHNKINAKSLRAVEWHSWNEIWCGCEDLCGFRDISHLKPFHFGLVDTTWRDIFVECGHVIVLKLLERPEDAMASRCRMHKMQRVWHLFASIAITKILVLKILVF